MLYKKLYDVEFIQQQFARDEICHDDIFLPPWVTISYNLVSFPRAPRDKISICFGIEQSINFPSFLFWLQLPMEWLIKRRLWYSEMSTYTLLSKSRVCQTFFAEENRCESTLSLFFFSNFMREWNWL